MFACSHDEAHSLTVETTNDQLIKKILATFRALEDKCKFVLCEGTDFTGVSSVFEFDFNADVANNLGAPVLVLVNGRDKTPEEINQAVVVVPW